MAQMVFDLVDTRELIATVREIIEREEENRLRAYLPNRSVEDIDYRVVKAERANRAASIRAFDAPAQHGRRPGATERRGSLPPISEILDVSEMERYRFRRLSGDVGDRIREAILNDAGLTAMAVANRVEMLRGEALSDGQIAIDEGGVIQTIDYEFETDLVVTASTAWSDHANADVLGDMRSWIEAYNDHGNDGAGVAVTSSNTISDMLQNEAIRALVYGSQGPDAAFVAEGQLNQLLQAHGLPPVTAYDRKVEDADGNDTRVIGQDTMLYLPGTGDAARALGETQWGLAEEAVQMAEARQIDPDDAPGLVTVTLRQDHPLLLQTLSTAIALPVINDPKRVLTADVSGGA